MGRWENGKMGKWEDGKMGRCEDKKMGRRGELDAVNEEGNDEKEKR